MSHLFKVTREKQRFAFTFTFRAFSRRFYPERLTISYIYLKKEKQQYISVGTVRMFIEPRAKH